MNYGLEAYKPGQVWERDGKRRQITSIADGYVHWKRPYQTFALHKAWCSTWLAWANKATLIVGVKK